MADLPTIETEIATGGVAALSEAPAVVTSVEQIAAMEGQPTNIESRLSGVESLVAEIAAFLAAIHPNEPGVPKPPVAAS